MIRVLYADAAPLSDAAVYASYHARLSETRREKTDRFAHRADRNLSVAAGILLSIGFEGYGLREREVRYELSENGKPRLAGAGMPCFNLSHSGTTVLAVFSDREIGCDIERVAAVTPRLAERFFHPEEAARVAAISDERARAEAICRLWTLKESYLKAVGRGLTLPMRAFGIRLPSGTSPDCPANSAENAGFPTLFDAPLPPPEGGEWSLREWDTFPDHRAAFCVADDAPAFAAEIVKF